MTPECFRERLLALASEYEELYVRYEAALVENCGMQRSCLDAPEAQLVNVTGLGQSSIFGLSDTTDSHENNSLLAYPGDARAPDQNDRSEKVKLSVRIMPDAPELDVGTIPSSTPNSRFSDRRRESSINRKKPLVQSLYDEGFAKRRRCMRQLHLLEDLSDDEENEGDQDEEFTGYKSDCSITTGDDLLLSEQIQDLWIKFAHMDKQGRGFVTGRDLNNYDQSGMVNGAQSLARMRRYSHTIERFSTVMTAKKEVEEDDPQKSRSRFERASTTLSNLSKNSARQGATLTFPSFVEMMLMEDCELICGKELADDILEIRHMFKMNGVLDLIAGKTNACHSEVEASDQVIGKGCAVEGLVGVVILVNAILIGVSSELMEDWKGWDYLEVFFGVFFFCELSWQIWGHGCTGFFFGEDWCWNFFDTIIVSMAVVDILLMIDGSLAQKLNSITIIRVIKLFRITRMVRLMKNKYFKELTLMVRGLVHGLKTLVWAMVVLLCLVYMIGVLLRQTIGAEDAICVEISPVCDKDRVYLYKNRDNFSSVGRAMFTTFRCLVDGCSSADGTPLMIPLMNVYGWPVVLIYVLIMVFVIFGLFNLIMAIFVENTLEAAKHDELQRQLQKSKEHVRVARKLRRLVAHFSMSRSFHTVSTTARGTSWIPRFMSSKKELSIDGLTRDMYSLEIPRERFEAVVMEKEVARLLGDLDINVDNAKVLFDVLDVDERGSIDLEHMITGLLKLRGSADKTDAVSCILGVRAIRKNLRSFEFILTRNLRGLWKDVGFANQRLESLTELVAERGFLLQRQSPQHPGLKAKL